MNKNYGECLFFDVGQGTSNVIFLGDRRALVIDVGPLKTSPVHRFLEKYRVERIECVVLSHNDQDHIAGWKRLATRFGDKIKKIYLLQDRTFKKADVFDLTMSLVDKGVIPPPTRAEVTDLQKPLMLWEDPQRSLRLDLLYPDMAANLQAQIRQNPNRTSAIAAFSCHGKNILFSGDSTLDAWRRLENKTKNLPVKVDILALPHHGGLERNATRADIEWLFTKCIDCRVATVSVGSHNRYGHPRPMVLEVLREKGVVIMCTQITPQCHLNRSLEGLRPGVIPADEHSLSAPGVDRTGRSVGCAGTVVAMLSDGGIEVQREQEHRSAVEHGPRSPMCV